MPEAWCPDIAELGKQWVPCTVTGEERDGATRRAAKDVVAQGGDRAGTILTISGDIACENRILQGRRAAAEEASSAIARHIAGNGAVGDAQHAQIKDPAVDEPRIVGDAAIGDRRGAAGVVEEAPDGIPPTVGGERAVGHGKRAVVE